MKALVATRRLQGDRDDDYMFCVPGELVWLPWICDSDRSTPGHGCGCSRSFGGLASHRATTTVEVAEVTISGAEFRLAYETSLRDQGWFPPTTDPDLVAEILDDTVGYVLAIAGSVPVGTVIRRDFDQLHAYV